MAAFHGDNESKLHSIRAAILEGSNDRSFADKETERIWNGLRSRKLPQDIQKRALDKLMLIEAADFLEDLRSPPSNRLHALKDDRAGQHSVSINDQWRICFVWKDGNAQDVEIVDYH